MAKTPSIYTDREIVNGLLEMDPTITSYVFYQRCYPLFKHLYSSYYTDCKTCLDLAHEIYVLIMAPGPKSGRSKLQTFSFQSSFDTWVSVVSHRYCYAKYKKRVELEPELNRTSRDRKQEEPSSNPDVDLNSISKQDIQAVVGFMPNKRYQTIIRLIYLEEKDNDETAVALGMSKDNLYNKHILAKAQLIKIMKREGLL